MCRMINYYILEEFTMNEKHIKISAPVENEMPTETTDILIEAIKKFVSEHKTLPDAAEITQMILSLKHRIPENEDTPASESNRGMIRLAESVVPPILNLNTEAHLVPPRYAHQVSGGVLHTLDMNDENIDCLEEACYLLELVENTNGITTTENKIITRVKKLIESVIE